jgi:hypothetical protein
MDRVAPGRGMLFIYPDAGQYRIWMYRMHFPFDLVWLNHRQQIIDITQGVPPCYHLVPYLCPQYGQAKTANCVLELRERYANGILSDCTPWHRGVEHGRWKGLHRKLARLGRNDRLLIQVKGRLSQGSRVRQKDPKRSLGGRLGEIAVIAS